MEQSPNTDKTLGVVHGWDDNKFRDVRARVSNECEERYIKSKRNKKIKFPKYNLDDEVVLTNNIYGNRGTKVYVLVDIVDVQFNKDRDEFNYFAIIKNVTHEKYIESKFHLVSFLETGRGWWSGGLFSPANVKNEGFTWL